MDWEVVNSRDMQDGGHLNIMTWAKDSMQVTEAGPGELPSRVYARF
jgi:hypothetical protein